MKLTRFTNAVLIFLATLVLPMAFKAAILTLDDFSSGPYQKEMSSSAGYKTWPRLDVIYGSTASLQLNLGSYDRFRVNFDGSNTVVNFNIVVFSPSGRSQSEEPVGALASK